MLERVETGSRSIHDYSFYQESEELQTDIEKYQRKLKSVRLCQINSTPFGGGVAELLYGCVPLLNGIGIKTDWRIISGDEDFYKVTKAFHNALQGADYFPSAEDLDKYIEVNTSNAQDFNPDDYDVVIIHDPQPAALRQKSKANKAKWVWRCHIDTSTANPDAFAFLRPYISIYDYAIFSLQMYVPDTVQFPVVKIMTPSIDPLSPKNQHLPDIACSRFARSKGIDTDRPVITQVSRFDIWKDPIGVIKAYLIAKQEIPGIQLVLVGSMANDDPEGQHMLDLVTAEVKDDPDIHIFNNLPDIEINALQRASNIVIQKSIREGFGLTVTEAMWKGVPVIGGNVGGIALQLAGELSELLVNSGEECADKIVKLLKDDSLAKLLGDKCQERVRENYLITRLLRDELDVLTSLL